MSSDRSPAELESDFVAIARAAAMVDPQPTALTTLLHIGDEHLVVLSGRGDKPEIVRQLDLGAARVARDFFRHDLPTSQEIERAIDFTEDEIMRLGKPAEDGTTLWVTGLDMRAWAAIPGRTVPIETVEQWFQRLAAASLGQPGSIPAGREAAATLLILREFMHHLSYPAITFADAARTQD